MKKRTSVTKFTTFVHLVFETFGRMTVVARRFRALSFQGAVTPRLICFSKRAGAFRSFSFLGSFPISLSLIYDRGPGEGELGR